MGECEAIIIRVSAALKSIVYKYIHIQSIHLSPGVVHRSAWGFIVRCVSLSRCAAVYAGGLHARAWRVGGGGGGGCQLGAVVEVPQHFYNRTVGLLGLWSSTRADDLLMSNGRVLPQAIPEPRPEDHLHTFGMSCEYRAGCWWWPCAALVFTPGLRARVD